MRAVGIVFVGMGLALFLFSLFSFFSDSTQIISPVPENRGVRVIYITPLPGR
ncbi:MAG: hypothetical protein WC489_01425 [Patescibacteria group bacterium]